MKHSIVSLLYTFVLISIQGFSSHAFCPTFSALQHRHATTHSSHASSLSSSSQLKPTSFMTSKGLILRSSPSDDEWNELSESDQILLGSLGTFAAIVVGYSEFTLKTTGCGLPAGPFGIYGLIEGLSYLGVTGIAAYATVTKVKTVGWDRLWNSATFLIFCSSLTALLTGQWIASRSWRTFGSCRRTFLSGNCGRLGCLGLAGYQLWLHSQRGSNGRRHVQLDTSI